MLGEKVQRQFALNLVSNGNTPGSGPGTQGSNPCPPEFLRSPRSNQHSCDRKKKYAKAFLCSFGVVASQITLIALLMG